MGIFGFKSSKEVEEEKRKAAEAGAHAALQKNQSNVENLGKGSNFDFAIPYFDVFDPRLQETGVPVSVFGSIVYAIEDMEAFRSMNKVEAFSDNAFKEKLKGGVTKFVKGVITNIPCDYQIPLVQMERKIIEISEIVQNYVIPQVERNFAIKVRSLDITKINIDQNSRAFRELKALTADFEQEKMAMQQQAFRIQQNQQLKSMQLNADMQIEQMQAQHNAQMKSFNLNNQMQNEQLLAQHNAQMKSFNLNSQMQNEMMMSQHNLNMAQQNAQLSNFNLNNSLQQDQLRRTHEMNMGSQEQMAKMQLDGQRMQLDAQRMQMDHQQAVNKVQLQEMQRASQLQTEQTFLEAHKANMQNSFMNNAMDMGYDPSQFGAPQQNMMGMQQNGFGQMPGFGAPQMPAMKAAVPQVQYNIYINEQQTAGPFDWNMLQNLVQQGQLTAQSYVWTQGMAGWELAGNVQELAPLFANAMPGMPRM